MTARERAIITVIESLPRDPAGLDVLPIIGVLRGAFRLAEILDADELQHLLNHPDSIELLEQRRSRTGVDWHQVLTEYTNYPRSPLRRLLP